VPISPIMSSKSKTTAVKVWPSLLMSTLQYSCEERLVETSILKVCGYGQWKWRQQLQLFLSNMCWLNLTRFKLNQQFEKYNQIWKNKTYNTLTFSSGKERDSKLNKSYSNASSSHLLHWIEKSKPRIREISYETNKSGTGRRKFSEINVCLEIVWG
jgi:hypothetical protein